MDIDSLLKINKIGWQQ